MKNFKRYYNWLLADAIMVILVGAFMCFFNSTSIFIFDRFINPYFWDNGHINDYGTKEFMHFAYNLSGVLMMVWGVFLLFILRNSFVKKEKWAWTAIFTSIAVWFPIDEFFSLYHGVYFNALFNLIFLATFLLPLLLSKKSF